ncbi:MAG: LytTR family DNA-binding domain-containing protein [Bacteroidales bacterium]|jgi:two-component system LytT family response regulator|nr:LytTR family DNA-binding domain-containing protein [Bacteroidales bacterium]
MQTKYRAIVVDDERLARLKLIRTLSKFDSIDVVGEAYDVPSAKSIIDKVAPDIIFLDIQMPKLSGFDLIEQTTIEGRVVFVTAFDNFALRAFDVNALDYLVKPVQEERIEKLLEKLSKDTPHNCASNKLNYDDKIFVSDNKFMKFIAIRDITSIHSIGNYSKIHLKDNENILVYKSLKEWELKLPVNKFCRIHRTTIVNIDHIEKIEKWFNYSYRVYINKVENPIMMSKRYSGIIRNRFS